MSVRFSMSFVLLQETHLNDKHLQDLRRRHQVFRKDHLCPNSPGGVAEIAQSGHMCAQAPLQTPPEAVEVRTLFDHLITLVLLYFLPNVPLRIHELQELVDQLPKTLL